MLVKVMCLKHFLTNCKLSDDNDVVMMLTY